MNYQEKEGEMIVKEPRHDSGRMSWHRSTWRLCVLVAINRHVGGAIVLAQTMTDAEMCFCG